MRVFWTLEKTIDIKRYIYLSTSQIKNYSFKMNECYPASLEFLYFTLFEYGRMDKEATNSILYLEKCRLSYLLLLKKTKFYIESY